MAIFQLAFCMFTRGYTTSRRNVLATAREWNVVLSASVRVPRITLGTNGRWQQEPIGGTWWLIPRLVFVGYNPSDLHGIRSGLIHL